ncbi:hypothetical protein [Streptomyces cylindrosporus]|uniref:Uncharacterized protein n=1 Tax=Streptomyces cylindrosporus TaxID=2927583 RepID=A0ABS9YGC1_9ACTN|nr:hypothetical protein [Streptomyces cylindrosporus]MCI3276276.1 hypothetical protein [Streptomyces cylindrosporus]
MGTNNNAWTPEMLRTSEGRRIHLQQRRQQIQPVVDDLRRLARELQADLAEDGRLFGDMPYQDRIRAWSTVRPIFQAVDSLESALTSLVTVNKRYEKNYEALPAKREAKALEKKRAKELKAQGGKAALNSADNVRHLAPGMAPNSAPALRNGDDGPSFMDYLSREA